MVKPAMTALLAILCLLLIKANIDTFRMPDMEVETETKKVNKKAAKKVTPPKPLNLNPRISAQIPDLGNGYLFNAERFLAKGSSVSKVGSGKGYGKNIRMDDVVFSGAILGEGYQKALVTYQVAPQPISRSTKRPVQPQRKSSKTEETVQLTVGDQLGGYSVKEITADFILFTKGSDTIKKSLFDPAKKRQQVAPRPAKPHTLKKKPGVVPPRRVQPPPPRP